MSIKDEIISIAHKMGIDKVGFTSRERLSNAPPSGDLGYVLSSAKSAVSLALALKKPAIRAYLSKEDQMAHVKDHKLSYMKLAIDQAKIAEENGDVPVYFSPRRFCIWLCSSGRSSIL